MTKMEVNNYRLENRLSKSRIDNPTTDDSILSMNGRFFYEDSV